jgi:hypothetical protein
LWNVIIQKKSSIKDMDQEDIIGMIEVTTLMVRKQSSGRGAHPLLQILEGMQRLADRLHEGHQILEVRYFLALNFWKMS